MTKSAEGRGATGRAFTHVFVYGTLRRGESGEERLRGCEYVGPAALTGTLYDVDGEFPALVLAGTDVVSGELWRCPPAALFELDAYEGVREGIFRRVAVEIGDVACWTYVAGGAIATKLRPDRRIAHGVWPAATSGS